MSNGNKEQTSGFFDRVDRKGTRLFTLVAMGLVFVILALLMLMRGGLPGPEKEAPSGTDAGPKVERTPAPQKQQ